jgi:signal transduction histidine kinase
MDKIAVISSILVLMGALFMAAAIAQGRKIRAEVPADLQRKWRIIITFMLFFLAGYLLFTAILLGNLKLPNELVASPIFLGGAIFVYIVVSLTRSTITRLKQDKQEIRRLNVELQQKIVQLQEAQEDLVRKEKLSILGELSGSVGHELRNPLGVMSNAVYFLKMVLTGADKTVQEYLDIIKQEIDNSLRIITDLLDFARTRRPQRQSISIAELIRQNLESYHMPENVTVTIDIPAAIPDLNVDPPQIGQVLTNFIANAVQAMPDGGTLGISARLVPESGTGEPGPEEIPISGPGFIGISITDSGEGVTPENMKKLFQPLFSTKIKGIGLGLVVCKNLVEANNGRIEVESEPGKRTTFTAVLPVEIGIL